jgi:hypothetical protein
MSVEYLRHEPGTRNTFKGPTRNPSPALIEPEADAKTSAAEPELPTPPRSQYRSAPPPATHTGIANGETHCKPTPVNTVGVLHLDVGGLYLWLMCLDKAKH